MSRPICWKYQRFISLIGHADEVAEMKSILREHRKLWCPSCKKEVALEPHLSEDLCDACRLVLKGRSPEDFEQVSDEEYERRVKEDA
jgi:hypothetical protein